MSKARDIASAIPAPSTVDATELGFLDGVTSAIQTQIDTKAPSSTAVTLTGTQTLTNKTLTNPVIASVVNNTLTSTTGDMIYASGANTPARLGIGSSAQVLTVASGVPSWATPSSGGMTLLSTTTLTGATTTVSSIDQTYKNIEIIIVNSYSSGANNNFIRFNGDTGSNYAYRFNNSGSYDYGSANLCYLGVMGTAQGYYDGTYAQITIPRYTETEYKMTNFIQTKGNNQYLGSNSWNNTAAITSITIGLTASQTMSGGTMYIYGVK